MPKEIAKSGVNLKVNQNQKRSKCKCIIVHMCHVRADRRTSQRNVHLRTHKYMTFVYNIIYHTMILMSVKARSTTRNKFVIPTDVFKDSFIYIGYFLQLLFGCQENTPQKLH